MYVCMYVYVYSSDMDIQKFYSDNENNYIYSVKISSPIGTINNSKVVDSAIIVKLGKYKIICRYDSTYGCRL